MRAVLVSVMLLVSASGWTHAQRLTVAAASSLTEVMQDLVTTFEARHPGLTVNLALAGSSTLATQILQGAPFDVFASANETQMDILVQERQHLGEPVAFASNQLVLITPHDSPVTGLADLAQDGVLLVLAGPDVPVGAYARTVLERLAGLYGESYLASVLGNVASEEPNVRQVAAKVALGEADAALVYATDAAILDPNEVITIPIEDAYNVTGRYPIVVLKETRQSELAQAFVDFVLSAEGQSLLAARGFGAP